MSSVSRGVSTPARPPASKTEAVRQDLHTHLRKTARFIKILDILVIFFAWAAAALMVWLLACLVDHWLFPLPTALRWAIWMAGLSATLWWSIAYLIPLLTRRINPVYAARRIENLVPEFKNGLVSWLELESMPEHGVPRGVMAALTYRAARFIGGQDPSATVDTSQLIKLIGGVLLLTTALAVYTMISPKSSLVTAHRILAPWASVSSPTRVHILQVKPGSVELTQGKPLEVEVNLRGLFADEPVFARFSTLDGQLSDQRVPLDVVSQGMRYAGLVTTTSAGVESELDYWIEAGDARRGPYRVTLSPLPTVALESISLEFPSYTKLEPRVVAASGEVEAVEGTWATIVAGANQSMSRGRLEVNPEIDGDGELIRAQAFVTLNVDDRKLSGKLLLKLNEQGDNPSTINYRIRGYNARRNANPRPILHRLSAFADVAPEVSLLGPDSRVARVAPDSRVNLECRAHDPDFGLTELRLVVHKNGLPLFEKLLIQSDGTVGRQVRSFELNLAEHQARVGDRFQIIATATDNRHDPVSGKAAPNSAQSEALLLEVAEPEQVDDSQPLLNPTQQPGGPPDVNAQQLADSLSSPQPPNSQPSAPNAGQEGGASPPAEQADAAASGEQRSNAAQQESPQAGAQQNKSNQTDQKSSSQPGNPAPDASPAQQSADQASGEQQPAGSSSAGAGSSGDKTQSGDSQQQGTPGGSSSSQNANPGSEQSPGSAASGSQSSSASPNSNSSPAAGSGTSSASPSSQTSAGGQSNTNASPSSSSSISQGSGGAAGQNGTATGDRPNQTNSGQTNSSQANSGQARSQSEQDGDAILRVQDFMKTQQDQAAADGASTARQKSDGSAAPKPTPAAPPSNTQPSTDQQAGGQQADSQQSGGQQSDGQQSGSQQSGAQQSGAQQSDSQQSGAQQSGAQQSDSQQSGGQQSGSQQSGAQQSGAQQSDSQQSGGQQSGSQQSGSQQSGGQQSGAQQAGSQQSGAQQSGAQQSGSQQSGGQQSGGQQSGAQQSGAQQSGGQQSDSQQSGGQQSGSQQSGAQQSGSQQSGGQQSGAQTIRLATVRWATVWRSTGWLSTVWWATIGCSAIRLSAVWRSTIRLATVWRSAVWLSTVRFATVRLATIRLATIRFATIRLVSSPARNSPARNSLALNNLALSNLALNNLVRNNLVRNNPALKARRHLPTLGKLDLRRQIRRVHHLRDLLLRSRRRPAVKRRADLLRTVLPPAVQRRVRVHSKAARIPAVEHPKAAMVVKPWQEMP